MQIPNPNSEYELIQYPALPHVHVFMNRIRFRNAHLHADYEMGILLEGSAVIMTNAKKLEIQKFDTVLFNPYEIHELSSVSTSALFLFVQFSNQLFLDRKEGEESIEFLAPYLSHQDAMSATIVKQSIDFAKEYFHASESRPYLSMALFYQLLDLIFTVFPQSLLTTTEMDAKRKKTERLRRLLEFIEMHYDENLKLEDFAKIEGLSLSYLSRFFKQHMDQSFQDYVKEIRFREALRQIHMTEKRISEISYDAGFSDPRYLQNIFMDHFGISIQEYREQENPRWMQETDAWSIRNKGSIEEILTRNKSLRYLQKL